MKQQRGLQKYLTILRVGAFLVVRDVKRSSKWTTILIVAVMVLTFLNLIVVSGILIGLIEGSVEANRGQYSGDLLISTPTKKKYVERSSEIISILEKNPNILAITPRYIESGRVEANYKTRTKTTELVDMSGGLVTGINPEKEDAVTNLSDFVVEGSYLDESDYDRVLIGANMLFKYTPIDTPALQTLKNVGIGTRVRLVVGGVTREVTIKGIIRSKVGETDQRIFMLDSQLRGMIGRSDYNVDEIAVKMKPSVPLEEIDTFARQLTSLGYGDVARIQTWEQAQPKFLTDIKTTFALLGNMIGSIGLVVASITIFIVIFVNAITRRRYIGILKGVGVHALSIEFSYMIQALFYAGCGMAIGSVIVFGILKPYIGANPIDFPFSDGILVATASGTATRAGILMVATMIAGYIPARLVVKQNTLDAILGR